jgi:hypothetical protein
MRDNIRNRKWQKLINNDERLKSILRVIKMKSPKRTRMPTPFEYPPLELVLDVQVEST